MSICHQFFTTRSIASLKPICFCLQMLCGILAVTALRAEVPSAESFGKTAEGKSVELYTLTNETGMKVQLMTRGATIVNLFVPDRAGNLADVVLGFDDVAGYESEDNQYFGTIVGRVANRIAKGKFTLDGHEYTLAVNNGPNALHGGVEKSFDKVVWNAEPFETDEGTGVKFSYVSLDGEEGYPGTVHVFVSYLLKRDQNELVIDYHATTDHNTPINLSNHSYFNLSGEGSETVLDHVLTLQCDEYTPVDETLIPTGEIASVEGTPLDFRKPTPIGERIKLLDDTSTIGYDHNLIVAGEPGTLRPVAELKDPKSGRKLMVQSTEPGVQFYSGNFLHSQPGKGGKVYRHRSAICLEDQHYPDSVNHPEFPSTILRPGEEYRHTTVWTFTAE